MTTVLGLRHGEVDNPQRVIYAGLPGYGLSENGRTQASAVAQAFRGQPLVAIYASPLDRAMETAGFVSELTGVEVTPDVRLHEWRYWQQWAGMTWEQLRSDAAESWAEYQADPGQVTGGESLHELADRMESWLQDVLTAHDTGVVLGVTHLEPLRALTLRKQGRPARDLFDVAISVCDVVRLHPHADPTPIPLDGLDRASGA